MKNIKATEKIETKPQWNTSHYPRSRNPLGDTQIEETEESSPSLFYLWLNHQAVQCLSCGKASTALEGFCSFFLGLKIFWELSEPCASGWWDDIIFLCWVAHWRTRKLTFGSHKMGWASVYDLGLSWTLKRLRQTTKKQKLPTLSILITIRISSFCIPSVHMILI